MSKQKHVAISIPVPWSSQPATIAIYSVCAVGIISLASFITVLGIYWLS